MPPTLPNLWVVSICVLLDLWFVFICILFLPDLWVFFYFKICGLLLLFPSGFYFKIFGSSLSAFYFKSCGSFSSPCILLLPDLWVFSFYNLHFTSIPMGSFHLFFSSIRYNIWNYISES